MFRRIRSMAGTSRARFDEVKTVLKSIDCGLNAQPNDSQKPQASAMTFKDAAGKQGKGGSKKA